MSYDRNLPNLITVASRELALWVRTRARDRGAGGWGQICVADPQSTHLVVLYGCCTGTGRREVDGKEHGIEVMILRYVTGRSSVVT